MEFKEGDIFRWYYKNPVKPEYQGHDRYWCKSRIGVVKKGFILDTYWGIDPHNDPVKFSFDDAEKELELTYLGNFNELRKLRTRNEKIYYDDCDIVDLTHANTFSHECYVKTNATKSKEKMLSYTTDCIDEIKRKIRSLEYDLVHADELIVKINSGEDLEKIYLLGVY